MSSLALASQLASHVDRLSKTSSNGSAAGQPLGAFDSELRDSLFKHHLFNSSTGALTSTALREALPALRANVNACDAERRDAEAEFRNALLTDLADIEVIQQAVSIHDDETIISNSGKQKAGAIPSDIEAIEDELLDLVQALTIGSKSDGHAQESLLKTLEAQQKAIADLSNAHAYYALLARAEDLHNEAIEADRADFATDDTLDGKELALQKLVDLMLLVEEVQIEQHRGDEGAEEPKALGFLRAQLVSTFSQLRSTRNEALRIALRHAGWPPSALPSSQCKEKGTSQSCIASARTALADQNVREAWFDVCALYRIADGRAWPQRKPISPRAGDKAGGQRSPLQFSPAASAIIRDPSGSAASAGSDDYTPLPCTAILLEPFVQRFAYHFDSNHPSNRLDKPEWFMSHLLDLFKSQLPLWRRPLQGESGAAGPSVFELYEISGYEVDTERELLNMILQMAKGKIVSSMSMLVKHPALLAHTLFISLDFDRDLQDAYPNAAASPGSIEAKPLKIGELLLSKEEWFEAWIEGETIHAMQRFEKIVDAPDAWAIGTADGSGENDEVEGTWSAATGGAEGGDRQGQSAPSDSLKSTKSSREVIELLEGVTARYAPLASLEQRILFILRIQLPILRSYAQRLTRSLEAFESLSTAFARHIPGGINIADASGVVGLNGDGDMVRGLRGLGRLLKALLSAHFVCDALKRWSETSLFVELSQDLDNTAEGQALACQIKLGADKEEDKELDQASLGSLLRKGIQSSGRAASGLRPLAGSSPRANSPARLASPAESRDPRNETAEDAGSGGVWHEPTAKFASLANRAAQAIERIVVSEVGEGLVAYSRRDWIEGRAPSYKGQKEGDEDEDEDNDKEDTPTPTLLGALSVLSSHLSHMVPIVEPATCVPIYRNISNNISTLLVDKVVLAGGSKRFDLAGGVRFRQDLRQGWLSIVADVACGAAPAPAGQSSHALTHFGALGRKPEAPWRYVRGVADLLALPSSAQQPWGEAAAATTEMTANGTWTLSKAIHAAFDEDEADEVHGWAALRRDLVLPDQLSARLGREILRRRIECWK